MKAILTYSIYWFQNYQEEIKEISKEEEWVRKNKEFILVEGFQRDISWSLLIKKMELSIES